MSKNGRNHAPPPAPPPVTLTEQLAVAIAFGNAASTFETVRTHAATDADRLPSGRFWYAGGVAQERDTDDRVVAALVQLVAGHGAVPADALYIHLIGTCKLATRGPFAKLPLADRLAYTAFATSFWPLLQEARREAARRRQAEVKPQVSLPDRVGTIGERTLRRSPTLGEQIELRRRRAEAAE